MDLYSIFEHMKAVPNMNGNEKDELLRRYGLLFYYMARSPFFEVFSESRPSKYLKEKAKILPFMSNLSETISEYIEFYRNHYFYTSGTQ